MLAEVEKRFLPIRLSSLQLDSELEFNLYLRLNAGGLPLLYREKHLPLTRECLQRLEDSHIADLFIDASEESAYLHYTEVHLGAILSDPNIAVDEKSEILYASSRGLMKEVLENPRAAGVVQRGKRLVEHTYDFLHGERAAFFHLLRVTSFDYYTYTHSVNVFVFSLALAEHAGVAGAGQAKRFAAGALLHDVGKTRVDAATLNCPGRLSEAQWNEMKQHPRWGWEILSSTHELDRVALDAVLHHHEKLNGKGYPDGLKNGQISPLVRVITIADIFDALTTRRCYKEAMNSFGALKLMQAEMTDDLDRRLFQAFVHLMGDATVQASPSPAPAAQEASSR